MILWVICRICHNDLENNVFFFGLFFFVFVFFLFCFFRTTIPTPHHSVYFAQFDWLEKKFYTSINSMSRNLGTIFLPPAHRMYNSVDKNTTRMTRLEL